MARPAAKELTERELEVMHAFWNRGESTVADVRDALAAAGLDRAYTTVATLVRILADKGFLVQTNQERPFSYRPAQSYEEVSQQAAGRGDRTGLSRFARALTGSADGAEGAFGQGAGAARGPLEEGREAAVNMAAATLWEGVVHATAFALLGILVYLVWSDGARRPARWPRQQPWC